MKARMFLMAIFSLAVLTTGSVFSENPSAGQTKSALKSWLQGLYDKLTSPAARPVTIDHSHLRPIPGKTVVIYYGNRFEVVNLNATNRAGLVRPYGKTK